MNYYQDEIYDVDDNASDHKSFKFKTKIVWNTREKPLQSENPVDANRPAQEANTNFKCWSHHSIQISW